MRNIVTASVILLLALGTVGCEDDSPVIFAGSLEVTTETTGAVPDPDGYIVQLIGLTGEFQGETFVFPFGANETQILEPLFAGAYEIELRDVAANCTVASNNPRTENVADEATTITTFSVDCSIL